MGRVPKFQFIKIQNPKRSLFNNMDLVWTNVVEHGKAQIIKVECTYIPHV
jgi:hypothetical protein